MVKTSTSRATPNVLRTAAILRFMASHPGQAFSLSEIARALKISPATCHSLLISLFEVGFLYRTSNKSYVLGPELAFIGRAAADSTAPLQIAQPEMRALADQFDVVCSASVLTEYVAEVVRARAESVSHVGTSAPAGAPFVIRVPLAGVFLSRMSDAEIDGWLDRHPDVPTPQQREAQHQSVAFLRSNGFAVFVTDDLPKPGMPDPSQPITVVTALSDHDQYYVRSIKAPVLASWDRVAYSLTLSGFNRRMSGQEIFAVAAQLKAACDRISQFVAGARLNADPTF